MAEDRAIRSNALCRNRHKAFRFYPLRGTVASIVPAPSLKPRSWTQGPYGPAFPGLKPRSWTQGLS
jgi:hypothetical protein